MPGIPKLYKKRKTMSNLFVRSATGVVFVAVMVAGLLLSPYAFGALFLVIMAVAMQEFYAMSLKGAFVIQQKMALLAAAAFFTVILCHEMFALDIRWLCAGLIPLMAMIVSTVTMADRGNLSDLAFVFTAMVYIGVPMCLSPFLVFGPSGFDGLPLLCLFIIIWASDVGAYCVGTALGQRAGARKLAPSISPKKSWWGFWGGIAFGVLAAVVLHFTGLMSYGIWHSLALGILISVAGVMGDLFESVWKRWFGVKDSGNCIPGHGGMLDRFDSSLMAIPVAVVYLAFFGLI